MQRILLEIFGFIHIKNRCSHLNMPKSFWLGIKFWAHFLKLKLTKRIAEL